MHAATDDESRIIRFANNPQDVPPFLVTDIDGQPVSTAEWKGKVVDVYKRQLFFLLEGLRREIPGGS